MQVVNVNKDVKPAIQLKFKHWWHYLFPSRRRWLREVNAIMNSPEVMNEVFEETRKKLSEFMLYGKTII